MIITLRRRKKLKKLTFSWFLVYVFMIIMVAFTALPLLYMVSTAFKPIDELFIYPPRFFVKKPTLQNFIDLLVAISSQTVPFTRYLFNSLFITVITVTTTVVVSCMGAYSMTKLNLPYGRFIFQIIVAALMFSPHVTQIPTYMVVNYMGLVNTYWALIIPKIAVAYNIFLVKQFMEQLPIVYIESARLEGAGEIRVFWQIIMPMMKPAWSTLVVFSFVANWNDYFSPLIYITSQAMKTAPLALQTITGGAGTIARVGAGGAATFLMTLPTIIIFTVMQGKVMQTMAYSGIKA